MDILGRCYILHSVVCIVWHGMVYNDIVVRFYWFVVYCNALCSVRFGSIGLRGVGQDLIVLYSIVLLYCTWFNIEK